MTSDESKVASGTSTTLTEGDNAAASASDQKPAAGIPNFHSQRARPQSDVPVINKPSDEGLVMESSGEPAADKLSDEHGGTIAQDQHRID
ncbi:hypothetical protein GJ744_003259 [Endocarpon pusillum]|uniref:Uncharacterized protein n=1 Tax=Endocarpon pusillum TaxID=364733 RepID=A0A8H7E0R2_9EURO|nr:hypothetical protein GJ744_003259 [Endocarpon pusillum]